MESIPKLAANSDEVEKTSEKSTENKKITDSMTQKIEADEENKLPEQFLVFEDLLLKSPPLNIISDEAKYDVSSPGSESDREWGPPRRPLSAYIFFSNHKRRDIVNENPDQPPNIIMSLIGKAWKSLTLVEKMPFIVMSENDKKRYDKQKAEYDENGKFYDEEGKRVKIRIKQKRSSSASRQSSKKKPRKSKD